MDSFILVVSAIPRPRGKWRQFLAPCTGPPGRWMACCMVPWFAVHVSVSTHFLAVYKRCCVQRWLAVWSDDESRCDDDSHRWLRCCVHRWLAVWSDDESRCDDDSHRWLNDVLTSHEDVDRLFTVSATDKHDVIMSAGARSLRIVSNILRVDREPAALDLWRSVDFWLRFTWATPDSDNTGLSQTDSW